jgi:hypothetical protein
MSSGSSYLIGTFFCSSSFFFSGDDILLSTLMISGSSGNGRSGSEGEFYGGQEDPARQQ